ncbi:MAG: SapC family protein [Desulfocapsa sp.]|nr:SapC family protein [Desulfocapsa sp.]
MSNMLLYKKIAFLNYSEFKQSTFTRLDDFSFASATGSIPLMGIEFVEAAKEFPIVFFKNEEGEYIPAVLLGVEEDRNHIVSPEGEWQAFFVPAYLHRYPFLSMVGENEDSLKICIDETYPGLDAEKGEPLFQEDGTPGPVLSEAMKLMQAYHFQMEHTTDFCRRLAEHDLLEPKELTAQLVVQGEPTSYKVSGVHIINEKKLLALDQEKVMDYFRKGEMAWIYCHLISLNNLSRVIDSFPAEN